MRRPRTARATAPRIPADDHSRLRRVLGVAATVLVLLVLALLGRGLAGDAGVAAVAIVLSCVAMLVVVTPREDQTSGHGNTGSEPGPAADFASYEDIVFGLGWGVDRGEWFRRRLVRVVAALLAERRGIDLDDDPAAARDALGEDAWRVVDDAAHPDRSDRATLTLTQATELVDRLERL